MLTIAAVWDPNPRELAGDDGLVVRRALPDQGSLASSSPLGAFVVSTADEWPAAARWGGTVWAWRVEEHVPRTGTIPCAVAIISLMRRNPELTPAEFAEHWTTRHAPLALRRHVGLADYHQYVVRETLTAATPEIDGIALLGFVARADFETRFFDSDDGRAEIMADVARFMGPRGREATLVGPPGAVGTAG